MQIHDIKRENKNKSKMRVGRGGNKGKTSGRGHKGQRARAGHKVRPEIRDFIKSIPKLRGRGVNLQKTIQSETQVVNCAQLESKFENGSIVSPKNLLDAKLVKKNSGKLPKVKILGDGNLEKKLNVVDCTASKSAKEKIEKAGGSIK